MSFDCNRCGACCRVIGAVPSLAHLDRGDGACKHLLGSAGEEHACAIYEDRPTECRVDESSPAAMTLAEWHRRNTAACERVRLIVYGGP
jgi:Fe-S-cluster containining protein